MPRRPHDGRRPHGSLTKQPHGDCYLMVALDADLRERLTYNGQADRWLAGPTNSYRGARRSRRPATAVYLIG